MSLQQNSSNQNTLSVEFNSGGIGRDRQDWEAYHKLGIQKLDKEFNYENRRENECFNVHFSDFNRIKYIRRSWSCGSIMGKVLTSEAQEESKRLIPTDAKLLKSNRFGGSFNSIETEFYYSESLKNRFSESDFTQGRLGCFTINYYNNQDMLEQKTTSYTISLSCIDASEIRKSKSSK